MKTILMLTANPTNTDRLRLDEEVREIESALERSKRRDQFKIISKFAVRVKDLRRALLDHDPQIVHFSGHGVGTNGLTLEDPAGQMQLVSTESLARLFELFKDQVECVMLNACYSEVQAEAIHEHIDAVVGMSQAIGDRAAINFAVGFYDALGAGRSVEEAFKLGCVTIDLEGIPESATPKLKSKPFNDEVTIISSSSQPKNPGDSSSNPEAEQRSLSLESPSGPVPSDSPLYVERYENERGFYEEIVTQGYFILNRALSVLREKPAWRCA